MNRRLKTLGSAALVSVAIAGFTAVGTPAKTGGHFVSDVQHTIVNQTQVPNSLHSIQFSLHGIGPNIVCDQMSATGTATSSTVVEELGALILANCHTVESETSTPVHLNGCLTRITIASGNPETTEQTNDITCPAGKNVEITHPNCTITIPPQVLNGITYTTVTEDGVHAITADVEVSLTTQFHAGLCVFLGTTHVGTFRGSTIVRAFNTEGKQVGVTAT